jgi:hypothetical protein
MERLRHLGDRGLDPDGTERRAREAHVVVSSSSPATVRAAEYEYVPVWVDHPPPPPPPPLDKIHPNWVPLYFLLALIVAWVLVMIAVQYSLRCWGPGSSGERKPLYYSTRPARKRDFGEPTWMGVDPSNDLDMLVTFEKFH